MPIGKISDLVLGIRKISDEYGIRVVTFGHAGDGNAHIDILKDNLDDKFWSEKNDGIVREIIALALSLGGTISGEHGIGYTKKNLLPMQYSEDELELMRNLKKVMDPANILNTGKAIL